jgi:hypothetical protein
MDPSPRIFHFFGSESGLLGSGSCRVGNKLHTPLYRDTGRTVGGMLDLIACGRHAGRGGNGTGPRLEGIEAALNAWDIVRREEQGSTRGSGKKIHHLHRKGSTVRVQLQVHAGITSI